MAKKKKEVFSPLVMVIFAIGSIMLLFNQTMIFAISNSIHMKNMNGAEMEGMGDLSGIDIRNVQSTGQALSVVYSLDEIQSSDDAMAMVFPKGTPSYGEALGVSFDDPIGSLERLSRMYPALKAQIEREDPQAFNRFMDMASKPMGISCEFCCGLDYMAIDNRGNSLCGCQHNPALLSIALWLSANSDYDDAEILREVMRWKALFFPKDMVGLATSIGTGKRDVDDLPQMVGGC